jgi:hypothetical protein
MFRNRKKPVKGVCRKEKYLWRWGQGWWKEGRGEDNFNSSLGYPIQRHSPV